MAIKPTEKADKIVEITEKLEAGIKDIFTSGRYASYLKTISKFHQYSSKNIMLIHAQMPEATRVCGFEGWKQFNRHVKPGEKGIKILAPESFKVKKETEKLDPDTQTPLLDKDGNPIFEEIEITLARFKIVHTFDILQTDGEPLSVLADDISGSVRNYRAIIDTLRQISPLPIEFAPLTDKDGICRFGDKIKIREGMSEQQTVSAIIHEIAHIEVLRVQDKNAKPKDNQTVEVEAEGISYSICQYYGVETGVNSFEYIAGWSGNKELPELKASLEIIHKTASEMIDSIDEKFRVIAKERGIDWASKVTETDNTAIIEPMPVIESKTVSDDILPDPAIGFSECSLYGYVYPEMLPLLREKALELFDKDHTIYMLYNDNTEAMVFDKDEIVRHDGIFGIERSEWEKSAEYAEAVTSTCKNKSLHEIKLSNKNPHEIPFVAHEHSAKKLPEQSFKKEDMTKPKKYKSQPKKNDKPSLLGELERNKLLVERNKIARKNLRKDI